MQVEPVCDRCNAQCCANVGLANYGRPAKFSTGLKLAGQQKNCPPLVKTNVRWKGERLSRISFSSNCKKRGTQNV